VDVRIRLARFDDVPKLIAVQASGEVLFRSLGMDLPVLLAPPEPEAFAGPIEAGRLWLTEADDGEPIAVLAMEIVDGTAHLAEVAVSVDHGRQGIGRALIDHAVQWSRAQGFTSMTLTTYAEVPWNGPYYERLGWVAISEDELTPGLRAIREHEIALGLDEWPRQAMTRAL
jgi:GNAT superfamily N-acetyltransferase